MIVFADPSAQYRSYQEEIEAAALRVMRGNRYVLGDEVQALEAEFSAYIGTQEAIGVANGTDALELALRALGVGSGDEVITVSHTAVATVAAIEAAGAIPVLVDVDPKSFTLNTAQLTQVLTKQTRAVIAVHLYGQAADLDSIQQFCESEGVYLIEDASQAHGALWKDGRRLGSIGHIGCFSCYPTKNLGAIGDAGLLTTNDSSLASRIRMVREYGWKSRYVSDIVGRNSRLDEIQAAILRVKLRHLDADNGKRQVLAAQYQQLLPREVLQLPQEREGVNGGHVYHLFVVRTKKRDHLLQYLEASGVRAGVHYPQPIHLQPAYRQRVRCAQDMSITEEISQTVLSLPMYPELLAGDLVRVSDVINDWASGH